MYSASTVVCMHTNGVCLYVLSGNQIMSYSLQLCFLLALCFAVLLRGSVFLFFGEIKTLFLSKQISGFFAGYEIRAAQLCISLIKKHSVTLQCRFLIMN
jgi:hypothetical protein